MSTNHFVAANEKIPTPIRDTVGATGDFGTTDLLRDAMFGAQYRIGLIPVENLINQSGSRTAVLATIHSALVLPLTWKELLVHIRAEADLAKSNPTDELVRFGAVTVNFSKMEILRAGRPVVLTSLQFKVLHYFVNNPGRVISREELLNKVWGYKCYPTTRTVDNVLSRLRQSVEWDPGQPRHFLTVHGTGYKFVPQVHVR
jgi:DNA-binding response OmpR family regulator